MNFLKTTARKQSIMVSYITIALNTLTSLMLTPFLLHRLGIDQYGLYQMIYSVAAYILILDLGISSTMVRFITEFRVINDEEGEANFNAIMLLIIAVIIIAIIVIGMIVNINIENIYVNLTDFEYDISHKVFSVMIIQIILTISSHYVEGLILSRERFLFNKIVQLCKIIFAFIMTIILVMAKDNIMGIVVANTSALVLTLIVEVLYIVKELDVKIKYKYFDWNVMRPALGLMIAMLLQSVIGHVNTTADKTILGILCSKQDVAVYSIGASIVTMFNTIPTVISGVFLPQATRLVVGGAKNEELTDFVIRPGRWQFAIIYPVMLAFILFGREFIDIWAGAEMIDAWMICVIIMIPNIVPLIQNVCLSILNAKNKRLVRSLILLAVAAINIALSIILVKQIGFWGAPISTAISYIIGHIVLMNIYYKKAIGMNIGRMFKMIVSRTWMCGLAAFIISVPLVWINFNGIIPFIIKCSFFCIIYATLMLIFGFNKEEKNILLKTIKRK